MSKKDKHMSNEGFGEVTIAETAAPSEPAAKKARAPRGSKPLDAISAAKQILALQRRVGAQDWTKVQKLVDALASVEA